MERRKIRWQPLVADTGPRWVPMVAIALMVAFPFVIWALVV